MLDMGPNTLAYQDEEAQRPLKPVVEATLTHTYHLL